MKFENALKRMREGKKIKRKDYTCCFFMNTSGIFVTYLYKTDKKTTELKEHFWLNEILAEDWEVLHD